MFANLLGCKGGIEHVACFGQFTSGAIVEANLDEVVVEGIHVFAHLNAGDEKAGIFDRDVEMLGEFLKFGLFALLADWFVAHLNLEDATVDEVGTEER